jgi:hypothetical protein
MNGKYVFHCIYRNPKSKLADMTHVFTDLLNTSQYHFYFGDYNSELLSPSARIRLKFKPVQLT